MKKMFNEFKEFAMKGNVVDMAIGVIIGGAFGKIVSSLVDDIFMPLIGLLFKTDSLTNLYVTLNGVETAGMTAEQAVEAGANILRYGNLISIVIDFLMIAVILFFVVKGINKLRSLAKKKEEPAPAKPARVCPYCKQEIADDATRCPHCTSELPEN